MSEVVGSHRTSESLARSFLTFFQLLVWHKTRLELLTHFGQTSSTHILEHIHEWWKHGNLWKVNVIVDLRLDFFLKSLLMEIVQHVAITMPHRGRSYHQSSKFELIYSIRIPIHNPTLCSKSSSFCPRQAKNIKWCRWFDWNHLPKLTW